MFEYPASSLSLYRSLFLIRNLVPSRAGKPLGNAISNFAKASLKEVQYVVRTIALFALVCTASASGYFVVLLCAHRQPAAGNGFDAVVNNGALLNDS